MMCEFSLCESCVYNEDCPNDGIILSTNDCSDADNGYRHYEPMEDE